MIHTRSGKTGITRRYQRLSCVPLRGDEKAMRVNWLIIEISDDSGKVTYRNSFITDLEVNRENVAEFAAGSRATLGAMLLRMQLLEALGAGYLACGRS